MSSCQGNSHRPPSLCVEVIFDGALVIRGAAFVGGNVPSGQDLCLLVSLCLPDIIVVEYEICGSSDNATYKDGTSRPAMKQSTFYRR